MPDTKRCEVCDGDKTIELYYKTNDGEIVLPCSCSPRPDDSKGGELITGFDPAVPGVSPACLIISYRKGDVVEVAAKLDGYHAEIVQALLLSYGKEQERAMWRKCREAVEKLTNSGTFNELIITNPRDMGMCSLVMIDRLDPDKSSPDAGREGEV